MVTVAVVATWARAALTSTSTPDVVVTSTQPRAGSFLAAWPTARAVDAWPRVDLEVTP